MKVLKYKIPDAVVVFVVTMLGYLFAYAFELGVFNYHGIDQNLVQITPNLLLRSGFYAVTTFFVLSFFFFMHRNQTKKYDISQPSERYKSEMVTFGWFIFPLALVTSLLLYLVTKNIAVLLGVLLFSPALLIVMHILIGRRYLKNRNWAESLRSYYDDLEKEKNKNNTPLLDPLASRVTTELLIGILVTLSLCFSSYAWGYIDAQPQPENNAASETREYGVIEQNNEFKLAIIRAQGELLIVREYDPVAKVFLEGFSVVSATDKKVTLEYLELVTH